MSIHSCSYYCDRPECIKAQRDELRERLAQPEKGPVAWESFFKRYCPWLEQPEQEPVAWEDVLGAIARGWTHDENKHKPMDVQLAVAIAKEIQDMVIALPQRKPLTDGEFADLWYKQSLDWLEFGRAIEAAHGIKKQL